MHPRCSCFHYLQYLLIDFRQTFVTGASCDTDDLITFLGQKVKVQGHTIAAEAHSTRRYRRVHLFLVCTVYCLMCMTLENDVLPCWIGPTNCQPKWLRIRSAEMRHEEKYFDCWSYRAERWIVNETTWKTVPKPPKSVFWKPNSGKQVFSFWILRSVRFGSVFGKPISEIFIGFRTPLAYTASITLWLYALHNLGHNLGNLVAPG